MELVASADCDPRGPVLHRAVEEAAAGVCVPGEEAVAAFRGALGRALGRRLGKHWRLGATLKVVQQLGLDAGGLQLLK